MKGMIKAFSIVTALLLGVAISCPAQAAPKQNFEAALVFLQKARLTSAVQAKTDSLKQAKEQLALAHYDKGGHRAAAMTLTMQAMAKVGEFKPDKANALIDLAILKVKRALVAIRQEASAKK
jgi:hypothetical protein